MPVEDISVGRAGRTSRWRSSARVPALCLIAASSTRVRPRASAGVRPAPAISWAWRSRIDEDRVAAGEDALLRVGAGVAVEADRGELGEGQGLCHRAVDAGAGDEPGAVLRRRGRGEEKQRGWR